MDKYLNYRYAIFFPLAVVAIFAAFVAGYSETSPGGKKKTHKVGEVYYYYSPIKDTFYLLGDEYIMISLKEQKATVITRGDSTFTYPISSGNSAILKGLSTPAGLYTVQSKNRKAISKQFNNAELLSWVGFNGNIGFHGLSGSGYYWNLGRRPSSHGCVRISREDGAKLFNKVRLGTPVLVYKDSAAVVLKFSDMDNYTPGIDFIIEHNDKATGKMIQNRINSLYSGEYYTYASSKIFLDGKSIIRNRGIRTGEAEKISPIQMPHPVKYYTEAKPDALRPILFYTKVDTTSAQGDTSNVSLN